MNAVIAGSSAELKRRIVEFVRGASAEVTPADAELLRQLAFNRRQTADGFLLGRGQRPYVVVELWNKNASLIVTQL